MTRQELGIEREGERGQFLSRRKDRGIGGRRAGLRGSKTKEGSQALQEKKLSSGGLVPGWGGGKRCALKWEGGRRLANQQSKIVGSNERGRVPIITGNKKKGIMLCVKRGEKSCEENGGMPPSFQQSESTDEMRGISLGKQKKGNVTGGEGRLGSWRRGGHIQDRQKNLKKLKKFNWGAKKTKTCPKIKTKKYKTPERSTPLPTPPPNGGGWSLRPTTPRTLPRPPHNSGAHKARDSRRKTCGFSKSQRSSSVIIPRS